MTARRRARPVRHLSRLSVAVTDGLGRRIAAPGLARWLARAAPPRAQGAVTVALVTDAAIRALNRTFRGKDAATDVLSFPEESPAQGSRLSAHGKTGMPLREPWAVSRKPVGDIVIARGVAARQARAEGHAVTTEYRVLALHGLLHLLGYDHERDRGQMRRLEDRLRRRAGLPGGLIGRGMGRGRRP